MTISQNSLLCMFLARVGQRDISRELWEVEGKQQPWFHACKVGTEAGEIDGTHECCHYLWAQLLGVGPEPVLQLLCLLRHLPPAFLTPEPGEYLAPQQSMPAPPIEARGDEKVIQFPSVFTGLQLEALGSSPSLLFFPTLHPPSSPDCPPCKLDTENDLPETI